MTRYLTARAVAEELGVSLRHAYTIVQSAGALPIGRLVMVSRDILEAWLKAERDRRWVSSSNVAGIWFARVPKRGGGTRRVSTLCTDKRAAEAALAQPPRREAVDPAYAASNKATTQRILDEYLLSRVRLGRSEGTKHHVRVKAGAPARTHARRPWAGTSPTRSPCAMSTSCLTEGARRTTIKKELRVLKAALKLARKMALWAGEPEAVIPELEDDYKPKTRTLTPWELVKLVVALGSDSPRAAHVVLIVATGARWSESLAVTLDEIVEAAILAWPPATAREPQDGALSARVVPIVGAARMLARLGRGPPAPRGHLVGQRPA